MKKLIVLAMAIMCAGNSIFAMEEISLTKKGDSTHWNDGLLISYMRSDFKPVDSSKQTDWEKETSNLVCLVAPPDVASSMGFGNDGKTKIDKKDNDTLIQISWLPATYFKIERTKQIEEVATNKEEKLTYQCALYVRPAANGTFNAFAILATKNSDRKLKNLAEAIQFSFSWTGNYDTVRLKQADHATIEDLTKTAIQALINRPAGSNLIFHEDYKKAIEGLESWIGISSLKRFSQKYMTKKVIGAAIILIGASAIALGVAWKKCRKKQSQEEETESALLSGESTKSSV